ncbi:uncharacterized protein LOC109534301 [Dendroctonus ponderosae]|uniref:Uncharacterized protein n=1 Tax=Dendroctonus ponderosae TaxID=77166 RepID=A0AAR5P301_DENPD|nr:uncharacterized protein LOC109534301 [Dendroctonus ponderosae]KAH1003860.1 hypothetical protein HUJ04_003710 [Dendroctonus ponderosae]KAH1003861.1 hypothetical protein HUJ04_003710 [Dendroctonus ponderosae]KAH1010417.1 hypothetical protein HUJ05_004719 [Dendroctonus ponderosae]KAH1010418.1 hypothetical protein HUJ05_004719 [Dendroctonus ponderosae]
MDFFGLTQYGSSNPIKDMLRDDYQELQEPPTTYIDNEYDHRTFAEKIKELDCYIGTADGYAYGSEDRLYRMRKKYLFKPVGPTNMFKHPGTNSMNYGWWNCDPELSKLSKEENWFKPRVVHSINTSEMSRFINYCLTIDKFFKM